MMRGIERIRAGLAQADVERTTRACRTTKPPRRWWDERRASAVHWTYYLNSEFPDAVELVSGSTLFRLERGDPWNLADVLCSDGRWMSTEYLARYHFFGSGAGEVEVVDRARAQELMLSWRYSGWLSKLPALLPLDRRSLAPRPGVEEVARAELRRRFSATRDAIHQAYASVPIPPGAERIGLHSLDHDEDA
jgi:hypothetical protein